ncbi:MAG: radical SAM protein [Myxococcales bacterium]|nr:radical SAM protein [Myxococcales bacterium]
MTTQPSPIQGRGTSHNPPTRYKELHVELDERPQPRTHVRQERARSILAHNKSPDIPFTYSLNPYRGCEHGCVYCYARPTHEYLGLSPGLDFETRLIAKVNAAELLREALCDPRWTPTPITFSGVTDPYQPIERELRLTRACLEVLAELRHPASIITKSHLVTRDLDRLTELASHRAITVLVSLTTLDGALHQKLEPRASHPRRRLHTIQALAEAGIPVGVMTAPIIPGLNDTEVPRLLKAAAGAGASFAGYTLLRLPGPVAPLFDAWLAQHLPDRRERVLSRIRDMRGGDLNTPGFGARMRGQGDGAQVLRGLFHQSCRRVGLSTRGPNLSTRAFRRPGEQLTLF